MTLKGYIGYCKNDPLGLQDYEVVLNKIDCSVTCLCGHYNQHGFLCRYIFCVFRIYGIHKIPDAYLNHRWTKNVLPTYLLDKMHRYAPCIEETDTLASQVHQTIEECIGLFRNDTDKLFELLSTIQDLKKKLENEMQTPHVELHKDALYSDLLDVTVLDKVVIKTPKSIFRSKGTRRIKSAAEKSKAKTIVITRVYVTSFQTRIKVEGGGNVAIDDEDEGDTDDQFDDEALGATKDEFDKDDEIDDEFSSDEE
nr:FAR1 DNA binding domain-containing protein [Tanacetum cinerariifolium]